MPSGLRSITRRRLVSGGAGVIVTAAAASTSSGASEVHRHRVVFQVDSADEAVMRHAISGSLNVSRSYSEKNEPFAIEILANASGIALFRQDKSPLLDALTMLRQAIPEISLTICGSSKSIAEQREGHELQLVEGTTVVPYGVVRLIELQEAGWCYIHA